MDESTPRNKRYRSASISSASSAGTSSSVHSASGGLSPPPKFHRPSTSASDSAYTCHLPPTCNKPDSSTSHTSQSELERHQLQFHNHICRVPIRDYTPGASRRPYTRSEARSEAEGSALPDGFVSGGGRGRMKECGKVFPDERFLELHQTEVHDMMAREKQANGSKIFECFIPAPQCGRKFKTPATRRSHLKAKHQYPNEYFFSITNHGLNQILQQEGLAASLIRPRRDIPVSTPAKQAPKPRSTTSTQPDPPTTVEPSAGEMEVDEMDDLAGQLDATLALAFVPAVVRRKGAGGKKSQPVGGV